MTIFVTELSDLFKIGLGMVSAFFVYHYGGYQEAPYLNWPLLPRHIVPSSSLFAIISIVVITGTGNAVNLPDGMDDLTSGCAAIGLATVKLRRV